MNRLKRLLTKKAVVVEAVGTFCSNSNALIKESSNSYRSNYIQWKTVDEAFNALKNNGYHVDTYGDTRVMYSHSIHRYVFNGVTKVDYYHNDETNMNVLRVFMGDKVRCFNVAKLAPQFMGIKYQKCVNEKSENVLKNYLEKKLNIYIKYNRNEFSDKDSDFVFYNKNKKKFTVDLDGLDHFAQFKYNKTDCIAFFYDEDGTNCRLFDITKLMTVDEYKKLKPSQKPK